MFLSQKYNYRRLSLVLVMEIIKRRIRIMNNKKKLNNKKISIRCRNYNNYKDYLCPYCDHDAYDKDECLKENVISIDINKINVHYDYDVNSKSSKITILDCPYYDNLKDRFCSHCKYVVDCRYKKN